MQVEYPRSIAWTIGCSSTDRYPVCYCCRFPPVLVSPQVKTRTDTLEIGSRAPEFSLAAANREGAFPLGGFLERGPVILEFVRGTW